MKLSYKQIEPFVRAPDPKARVILIYGPDQGLMKERSSAIAKTAIADINDPFNVVTLTTEKILADPSLFFDEALAQSLMGGDRLIFIRDAGDSLTPYMKEYLDNPSQETLVLLESGDLGPKSALRKLCESAKNAAAVPCYVDDERTVIQIIRDMCMHAGYSIDQDALSALSSAIIGDRTIARNEIEKLVLYKGIHQGYKGFAADSVRERLGTITLEDVMACSGDVRDWSLERLVYSVADGNIHESQIIIDKLLKDQIQPVAILRILQSHFWRLHSVNSKVNSGVSREDALKSLTPPLFWKVKNQFLRQLGQWSVPRLEAALDALHHAEIKTKKTEYQADMIVKNVALQLIRHSTGKQAA